MFVFFFLTCFLFQIHSGLYSYDERKISIMILIIWQSFISSSLLSFSANASIFSASSALQKSVPPPSGCFPHMPTPQSEVSCILVLTSALISHFPQIFFQPHIPNLLSSLASTSAPFDPHRLLVCGFCLFVCLNQP